MKLLLRSRAARFEMAFLTASNAAQIRDGLFRAVGITAPERAASFPDVPTMKEAGVDGMSAVSWAGFLAPARTPAMIIKKLETEIIRIVKLPDVQQRLRAAELDPVGNSAEEFARTIKADVTTWTAVAKAGRSRSTSSGPGGTLSHAGLRQQAPTSWSTHTRGLVSMKTLKTIRTDVVGSLQRPPGTEGGAREIRRGQAQRGRVSGAGRPGGKRSGAYAGNASASTSSPMARCAG